MNQVYVSEEDSESGKVKDNGWMGWLTSSEKVERLPDSDKDDVRIPDADEVVGTEAVGVEAFHDGSTMTRCCASTPSGCRAIYLGGKSMAVKTRFVFVSSIIGGVTGIMCFTLTTNPMYYLEASGCDAASPYFSHNANLTSDRWRISPAYGVCPDSGRVTVCDTPDIDDDGSCFVQFINCF